MSTKSDEYPVTAVYFPRKILRIKEACSNKAALPDTFHAGGTGSLTPAEGPAMKQQDQGNLQQIKEACWTPGWMSSACRAYSDGTGLPGLADVASEIKQARQQQDPGL